MTALQLVAEQVSQVEASEVPMPPVAAPIAGRERAVLIDGVSKVFHRGRDSVLALDRVSLEVGKGEFVCVVGASGCGKSTLLSLLAGLDKLSGGRIELPGKPALMFQESALLPWLTASQNVELPMRLQHAPRSARKARSKRLLRMVHLEEFADRRPHELSGGMRQRVALARALAQDTELLLMDEPFAALDAITRDILHEDLMRISEETGVTVIFVTHNVREAVRLGDRVVLLSSRPGRVVSEWDVTIPGPRSLDSVEVAALSATITERLREEISRHGSSN